MLAEVVVVGGREVGEADEEPLELRRVRGLEQRQRQHVHRLSSDTAPERGNTDCGN